MRATVMLACVALCGCPWQQAEEAAACAQFGRCDAGASVGDGGEFELTPRPLQPGTLVGLSSLGPNNAWLIMKAAGAGGTSYFLSPQGTAQGFALAQTDPRAVFGMPGLSSYAVANADGNVTLHGAGGATGQSVLFERIEPQVLTQYYDNSGTLQLSVWGTVDGGIEYAHQISTPQGPIVMIPGCGRPHFHDVEILGEILRGGALISLHTEVTGCPSEPFTSAGPWIEHVDNAGRRRAARLGDAGSEAFAVGRLERPDAGDPVPMVGYSDGNRLVTSDVTVAEVNLSLGSIERSVQARNARFGDFVRGSTEPIITGVTAGSVTSPSDAGVRALDGGASYAFAVRLTEPGWVKRLGPAQPGAKVLGVKVGNGGALIFAWDSPTGVVWTVLSEGDGRELR